MRIAYVFEWPESAMSDVDFINLICSETAAGLLLDVENLHVNARNHGVDAHAFLDALPAGIVKEVHIAGGMVLEESDDDGPYYADSHSHPAPAEAFDLLDKVLACHSPAAIVLERDKRVHATQEILDDVAQIRAHLLLIGMGTGHATATARPAG